MDSRSRRCKNVHAHMRGTAAGPQDAAQEGTGGKGSRDCEDNIF